MECIKCGQPITTERKKCMYCGASAGTRSPSIIDHKVSKDGIMIISGTHCEAETLQDLPERVRSKIENTLRDGKNEVIIKEERTIVHDEEQEVPVAASLKKVVTLLSKMKATLEGGTIGHREYNQMAVNIIKDYVSTLPEDIRLNFVMNDIKTSELSGYINNEALKDLRAFVLASKTE